MDHPILNEDCKDLRKRVVQLFSGAYTIRRGSNIVFLCGGKEATHMRIRFRQYCEDNLGGYEIFMPEAAMENLYSNEGREPLDLADFEEMVATLSHAVVVFPEAPGSFAETGYFSAIEKIAEKCILVLDSARQGPDSFISLGPAAKFEQYSAYRPTIQLDYNNPTFQVVAERIERLTPYKNRKTLSIGKFKDHSYYEILAVIHEIIDILSIATIDDILYIFRALFHNQFSEKLIRKLASVLVGSSQLREIGEFGHLAVNQRKPKLLELREGYHERSNEIRLELASKYQDLAEPEIIALIEESRDVD